MGSAVKKSVLLVAALCALAVLPAAAAASSNSIIQDCTDDGALNGNYSAAQLKNALGNIPSDVNQYYACDSLIQQALLRKLDKPNRPGGSGGAGGDNSAVISKAQRNAIAKKVTHSSAISLAAEIPAPVGVNIEHAAGQTLASTATPSVPTALIIAVIGMFLLFAAELGGRVAKRIRRAND